MNTNWRGEKWYIDTHAGTGKTKINGVNIDGSALIALENHIDSFDRFYFYEVSKRSFERLQNTISERFGYDFEVSPVEDDEEDFLIARCEDPYIRIMHMDSNRGVENLAGFANSSHHWFVFMDPKGLTAKRTTVDALAARSNMDLLLTYQTTGVLRSAAEGAEHAHGAVDRTVGDSDWPNTGSEEDYVEMFQDKLEENPDMPPVETKELVSPKDHRMRFDLLFVCEKERVREIMKQSIMGQKELWSKASKRTNQTGLDSF